MNKLFSTILLTGLLLNIAPTHAGWFDTCKNWFARNKTTVGITVAGAVVLAATYMMWKKYYKPSTPPAPQPSTPELLDEPQPPVDDLDQSASTPDDVPTNNGDEGTSHSSMDLRKTPTPEIQAKLQAIDSMAKDMEMLELYLFKNAPQLLDEIATLCGNQTVEEKYYALLNTIIDLYIKEIDQLEQALDKATVQEKRRKLIHAITTGIAKIQGSIHTGRNDQIALNLDLEKKKKTKVIKQHIKKLTTQQQSKCTQERKLVRQSLELRKVFIETDLKNVLPSSQEAQDLAQQLTTIKTRFGEI